MANEIKNIITELERQRTAIDLALEALQSIARVSGLAVPAVKDTARRPGSKNRKIPKRIMSEEGRRRVAEAQRKRWAAKKRADQKLAKKAA